MPLPDPAQAGSLNDLVGQLRLLKAWSHDLSYAAITRRVNDRWRRAGRPRNELTTRSTVAGYFTFGRSRLDEDLLVAIVGALHAEPEYAERWRHALRAIRGDATVAGFVDARCGLPAAPSGFVGRHAELRCLDRLAGAGATVVICGMAGIGKTWLAVHAAHRLLGRMPRPRLQLAADLRGFDSTAPPAGTSAVLAGFLRHLGLRCDQIPPDLAGRAETYQALVREVPAVVVLDNAADDESVAPLVPEGPDCFVMVTSRRRLAGLRDAAHLRLAGLDPAGSFDLLRGVAGAARVDADPAGTRRIAARVGGHPLALSIVGRALREHPDWTVDDCPRPVGLVLAGGLRSTLGASLRALPATARRVLRLLAVHPGHDIGEPAVAALAELSVCGAHAQLGTLLDAHLVEQPRAGRYALHELVRGHAAELLGLEEPASQIQAATLRLFEYYRRTAAEAVGRIRSAGRNARPGNGTRFPVPATAADARRWLADEYANLLAITTRAAATGWPELGYALAATFCPGRYPPPHADPVSEIVRTGLPANQPGRQSAGELSTRGLPEEEEA